MKLVLTIENDNTFVSIEEAIELAIKHNVHALLMAYDFDAEMPTSKCNSSDLHFALDQDSASATELCWSRGCHVIELYRASL
jgi:hypothetical protein